ncbi:MAG: hypothetical protein IKL85_05235, partial [Lentisphaeria bacterium]|nr:hypothetical protein [Lentisphaeria bacterium]
RARILFGIGGLSRNAREESKSRDGSCEEESFSVHVQPLVKKFVWGKKRLYLSSICLKTGKSSHNVPPRAWIVKTLFRRKNKNIIQFRKYVRRKKDPNFRNPDLQ